MAVAMTRSTAVVGRSAQSSASVRPQARRLSTPLRASMMTSTAARADVSALQAAASVRRTSNATRQVTVMGNPNTTGPFSPLVEVTRNLMGKKEFNKFRGSMIAYHSQVIRMFIGRIGGDNKMIQGLIKKAKKNGERLGFLA